MPETMYIVVSDFFLSLVGERGEHPIVKVRVDVLDSYRKHVETKVLCTNYGTSCGTLY